MSEGEGFARRVTLENLYLFAPLLKASRVSERPEDDAETENEGSTDEANQDFAEDPALAAAEALFNGESIKTGIRYSHPTVGRRRKVGRAGTRGLDDGQATSTGPEEVLLMRLRRRRDGKQVQISMIVHNSSFMKNAPEVVSAADGVHRRISYNKAKRRGKRNGKSKGSQSVRNVARFEAPEMRGITNPVARFSWVTTDSAGPTGTMLQYEIFDPENSKQGREILEKLAEGIATPPATNLRNLSRQQTVLSVPRRENAQWYRLDVM